MAEALTTCYSGTKEEQRASTTYTIKGVIAKLLKDIDVNDQRQVIPLGKGDPSDFPSFRAHPIAVDAVVEALRSGEFNSYSPHGGILSSRRSVAEYLSHNLPYELSPEDVYLTCGTKHAIEIMMSVLARPGANILLPRPGFPMYESFCRLKKIEVRHFDLLPGKDWMVDLDGVDTLADENSVAMVIINPGNPCGNVYTYEHLQKVAQTARKLGMLVISDEVYGKLVFGDTVFVPMGVFSSIVPVITLGSISKRWFLPGWRLGWIAISDNDCILKTFKIVDCIKCCLNITSVPPTFIQAAIPQILLKTPEDYFENTIAILREAANLCWYELNQIACISCPSKPEGCMFIMVKLNLYLLDGIKDDTEFCVKLAREESVIVLPGITIGLKNWLRITFAIELNSLKDGLSRIKAFCKRYATAMTY